MDIAKAMVERHSVRQYLLKSIEEEKREVLDKVVEECNSKSGLSIRIVYDDLKGFDSRLAKYGKFENVSNYIILAGPVGEDIDERCGYYGEKIVLEAQMLGLNTCWAALTFNKGLVKKNLNSKEKLCMVIALGYGKTQGVEHRIKPIEQLMGSKGVMPKWFMEGVMAAMMAPTAMNQQKFKLGIKDGEPVIKISGRGFYTKVDLGIVKYHFEVATGRKVR